MTAATLHWKDCATLGASLFLNVYFVEWFPAPFRLAASPLKLAVFVSAAGAMTATAIYFSARGVPEPTESRWPLESHPGRLLYIAVLLQLVVPLCILSAVTTAHAALDFLGAMTPYRPLARVEGIVISETIILLAWAAWVGSRGRKAVATAARLWVFAFLALLLGGCLRFWREIRAFVAEAPSGVFWEDVVDSTAGMAMGVLPLTALAGVWRPRRDVEPESIRAAVGTGAAVGAMVLLACLCLAGVSVVTHDGDLIRFHFLARFAASPYGEARLLVVTLSLLPLLRVTAWLLTEVFMSLLFPWPSLAAFGVLAVASWLQHSTPLSPWDLISTGSVTALCVAGTLAGKGMAKALGDPGPAARRQAEWFGLLAGLALCALDRMFPFHPLAIQGPWSLGPYLAAGVVSAASATLAADDRLRKLVRR